MVRFISRLSPMPRAGRKAIPPFKMRTLDGKTILEHGSEGKGVVLDFWATWCEPCKLLSPAMQRIHETYGSKGVFVVGVERLNGQRKRSCIEVRDRAQVYVPDDSEQPGYAARIGAAKPSLRTGAGQVRDRNPRVCGLSHGYRSEIESTVEAPDR